jgi:hypothetical protein
MNHSNKIVAGFLAASAVFFGIAHAQGPGPGCDPDGRPGMKRSSMQQRMKDEKALTAPERMAQMQASMKERVAAMDSVNESFTRLYSALTPEQKAAADKHFAAVGHHPAPGRGGPRGEGQGGPAVPEARKG